jgi:RNA polymerase sigma factor (sigma-70 family)
VNKDEYKDDGQLHQFALTGGPEGFSPIVERYQDAVFGIALARLGSFHDAQDVAQQVFVAAFERLAGLRDPGRLGAWLRAMTIHRCIDLVRQRKQALPVEHAEQAASSEPTPPAALEHQELRQAVLDAIARLSGAQRETTTLFYVNGYSVEQVAAMQEVPVGTIKRRLHDARQRLKEEMIGMVENVLKSEAPKEDFAEQVFTILCQYRPAGKHPYEHLGWHETIEALRKIGGRGLDGFMRALDSRHSATRVFAMHMLEQHNAPQDAETIIQLLVKGLSDPNRKVRRHAVEALLRCEQPAERKRREFVPRIVSLLEDPSIRVRRQVAAELVNWWEDVPLAIATRALLAEKDGESAKRLKGLVHAIVHGGERRWYSG